MQKLFGADTRRIEVRDHEGKPAFTTISERTFDTTVEDLWNAITNPERIARWFTPVSGELKLGGRYRLEDNAEGTIERCDPPEALDLSWEFAGTMSWVRARIRPDGGGARLTLEHFAHMEGPGAEHFQQFGPAAGGVGWDLGLEGLRMHLAGLEAPIDPEAAQAWMGSEEGRAFIRASGEAWAEAHIAFGADPEEARAMAERTIAFYSGG